MRAIHTYIPSRIGSEFNKKLAYNMVFSVACAKDIFGEVYLYTNEEIAEVVRKIGIPYDGIITDKFSNSYNSTTFAIPKMVVYASQEEPFIHLDLDTFMYARYQVPEGTRVFYATPDNSMERGSTHFINTMNLYETYLRGVNDLEVPLPKEFTKYINFLDIPNMNIFGGQDYELIKEASKYAIKLYEENRTHYDSEYNFACVVEQLYISTAIKMLYGGHYENYYLYKNEDGFRIKYNEQSVRSKFDYPIVFSFNGNDRIITDENHLYQFVNYDFNTTVHLCGNKYDPILQFLIKETANQKFSCVAQLKNINRIFREELECDAISKRYYKHLTINTNLWSSIYHTPVLI